MNFSRLLAIGFTVLAATATAGLAQYTTVAQVPAPGASPLAAPTTGPQRGRRAPAPAGSSSPNPKASPSETPEPPQFSTLDGVWEVELQPLGQRLANYAHLDVTTTGATITGFYQTNGKKGRKLPMTGTFDGRLIAMNVTMPNGDTATFNGYVETFADMVGLFRANDKDSGVAFTAEHRKKIKS